MSGNRSLHAATRNKNDEFYTQLTDIEKELRHYRQHFKNKTVFCNCDDPFESNFFKYFVLNFNRLELKKLIATCYVDSPIAGQQLTLFDVHNNDTYETYKPYKAVVTKVYDTTGDGSVNMLDVAELFRLGENVLTELKGDGDFRSDECIELLKEADIVVTNPPFSLWREYVAQLIEYKKKFLIIGSVNALTYKEIFPLFMENKVWLGYGFSGGNAFFKVSEDRADDFAEGVYNSETGLVKFRNCHWFTNLDIKKRHNDIILVKRYNPADYPKYDNYDAINVDRVADIPCDYFEDIGVPITFMDKYNPEQFEVVKFRKGDDDKDLTYTIAAENNKQQTTNNKQQTTNNKQQTTNNKQQSPLTSELLSGERCNGIIGVPITFMDKYNPEQFEILGLSQKVGFGLESHKFYDTYKEIRQDGSFTGASGNKTNGNPVLAGKPEKNNYYINENGDCVHSLYARVFIKRKQPQEANK